MKKIIFTMSHKGGAGKSTFARILLEHFRTFAPDTFVAAIDGQPEIGHLANFYGHKDSEGRYDVSENLSDLAGGVIRIEASNLEKLIGLVDILDAKADIILVDLPGGAVKNLAQIIGNIEDLKAAYAQAGYELFIAIGINHFKSSASSIHDILDTWGDGVQYISILNLGLARRDEFLFYDGERAFCTGYPAARLAGAGAKEFNLYRLDASTYALLDAAECPVRSARDMSMGHRLRLQAWLARMDAEIYKLGLIGYSAEQAAEFEKTLVRIAKEAL